ncbi:MAG: hypothetical protein ACI9LM_005293 [Alteromonadaceae bacterium]|jgi:uncharacterized protein (TIGR02646 family)
MADIKIKVDFDKVQQQLIGSIILDPQFKHTDWNREDYSVELEALRKHIRDHYRTQQHGKCAYCKKDISVTSALNCHVEHIAPKSKHEKFIFDPKNLCIACADCNVIKKEQDTISPLKNGKKRTRYPSSANAFKIIHPHFDNWDDHLKIFGGRWYIDKLPKGNFTIGVCKLNQRSIKYGIDEPNEMVDLAIELTKAKREKNTILIKILKNEINRVIDE